MSKDNIHEFTLRREIWKYFLSRRMQLAVSLKYLIRRGRGCTSPQRVYAASTSEIISTYYRFKGNM